MQEEIEAEKKGHSQVEELELSKAKATDLLKMHEGDVERALTAYVRAGV